MKHTPGPWSIRLRAFEDYPCVADDAGRVLCHVCGGYPLPPRRNEANARLIAAAPELFEALESATAELERLSSVVCPDVDAPLVGEVVARARAALAKAKGGDK